jgi:arylsulfatase A-like enzyme
MVLGIVVYARQPNVVVILTDDMGYWDTGFSGGPVIETPNLDKLAARAAVLRCLSQLDTFAES